MIFGIVAYAKWMLHEAGPCVLMPAISTVEENQGLAATGVASIPPE